MPGFLSSGWPLAALRLVLLGAGAAVLWEMAARIGAGFLPDRGKRDIPGSLTVFGVGLLLGWPALGFTFLGLSLVGLFYPPLIVLGAVALLASSRAFRERRSFLLSAARGWGSLGWPALVALVAVAFPLVPHMLVPEVEQDVYAYHLGAPWQFLLTHRVQLECVYMDFHLPLTLEMTFALPLVIGYERLCRWLVLSFFVAASSVWAALCLKEGRRTAAWLGPLVALSTAHLLWLLTRSKNDVAAAAFFVAGALLQRGRPGLTGALLFGLGAAVKPVFAPLAVVWWIFNPPPAPLRKWWRDVAVLAALFLLPVSVWWVKTWLATGNPVYPLATGLFPTFDWDARNAAAYRIYIQPLLPTNLRGFLDLPSAFLDNLGDKSLLLPLALPAVLLLGRWKRASWACVAGGMAILAAGKFSRFMLPATWLFCLVAAREATFLAPRWRVAAVALASAYSFAHAATNPLLRPLPWENAAAPFHYALADELETFGEKVGDLAALKAQRVITMGEMRSYRVPARVIFTGMLGQTPLIWKTVRESRTERDLDRRFRQMGRPLLLHNLIGSIWKGSRYWVFEWDERMLKLYHSWFRSRMEVAAAPRRSDTGVGCYYVYRFLPGPRSGPPPPAAGYFLPGAESAWVKALAYRAAKDYPSAISELKGILRIVPALGMVESELGFIYYLAKKYPEAIKTLKPIYESRVLDSKNFLIYGLALAEAGYFDAADRVLVQSSKYYPMAWEYIQADRGEFFRKRAEKELAGSNWGAAERRAVLAWEHLKSLPPSAFPEVEASRKHNLALTLGLRGDLARRRGRAVEAAGFYREALGLQPDAPQAAEWQRRLDETAGGSRGKAF